MKLKTSLDPYHGPFCVCSTVEILPTTFFGRSTRKRCFPEDLRGKIWCHTVFVVVNKLRFSEKNNEKKWQLLRKANSLRKGSGSDSSVTMGFKNRRVQLGQVKWPREKIYPGRLPPKLCVRQTRSFFCSRKNHGPRRHPGKYLLDGMTGWYVLDGYLRVQSYQTSGSYGDLSNLSECFSTSGKSSELSQ